MRRSVSTKQLLLPATMHSQIPTPINTITTKITTVIAVETTVIAAAEIMLLISPRTQSNLPVMLMLISNHLSKKRSQLLIVI